MGKWASCLKFQSQAAGSKWGGGVEPFPLPPSWGTELGFVEPDASPICRPSLRKRLQNHKYKFAEAFPGPWKGPKQVRRTSFLVSWPYPAGTLERLTPALQERVRPQHSRMVGPRQDSRGQEESLLQLGPTPCMPRQPCASPTQEQEQSGI